MDDKHQTEDKNSLSILSNFVEVMAKNNSWGWAIHPRSEESEESEGIESSRDEYDRMARLLEQRKKEVTAQKRKLTAELKKARDLVDRLQTLVDRYGELQDSAKVLAEAMLKLEEDS